MTSQDVTNYDSEIKKLMNENRTDVFFILYDGFLTNHMSHGIRALQMLGAPLPQVKNFVERYKNKLESGEFHKNKELKEDPEGLSPDELIGARKSFYFLYDHYTKLLNDKYSKRLDDLVRGEFPRLSRGIIAVHCLIHLGYGMDSGLAWFVCEGLAYLHYYYVPLSLSASCPDLQRFGHGNKDILAVLDQLREDGELITYMNEAAKQIKPDIGDFQKKTRVLCNNKGDVMVGYVNKVKFPCNLNQAEISLEDIPSILNWLINSAIIVYAIAETPNSFFLLHGVTSSWSLKNVLGCLDDIRIILDAIRTHMCTLFVTYMVQGCPLLQRELISNNPAKGHDWSDIRERAVDIEMNGDEHIYKLVQVCRRMTEESTDETMTDVYKLAAYLCISNPLHF